jgi:two-component system nitrate/nitrite response regulator NarL
LREAATSACVLALAVDDTDADSVIDCARYGFQGFIPRRASLVAVPPIIREARRGEVSLAPKAAAGLMRALAEPAAPAEGPLTNCLTRREREICSLVAEGLTNKEIAREVNRSVGTVKNHVRSILIKLELPRRGTVPAYLNRTRVAGLRH